MPTGSVDGIGFVRSRSKLDRHIGRLRLGGGPGPALRVVPARPRPGISGPHSLPRACRTRNAVEPGVVEKERVISKQPVQLRNSRMVLGYGLGLELVQGFLDQGWVQSHACSFR